MNMKTYKSILAFGESHIAGCELGGHKLLEDFMSGKISLEDMDSKTRDLSFPSILAKKLNIPCFNFALSGGSNERTLRLLPTALTNHPDSLVIVGYSERFRKELYFPDKGNFSVRDTNDYVQLGMHLYKGKLANPINKLFVEELLRYDKTDYTEITNAMFYIDQSCNDVLHVFINGDVYKRTDIVNSNNILDCQTDGNDGYGNFDNWCKLKGYKQTAMNHYPIEAHSEFADFILLKLGQD